MYVVKYTWMYVHTNLNNKDIPLLTLMIALLAGTLKSSQRLLRRVSYGLQLKQFIVNQLDK